MITKKDFIQLATSVALEYTSLPKKHQTPAVKDSLLTIAETICFQNPRFDHYKFIKVVEDKIKYIFVQQKAEKLKSTLDESRRQLNG